jgi:CRP/FNR family transcriptional regulator, anaerobic regulatory protein
MTLSLDTSPPKLAAVLHSPERQPRGQARTEMHLHAERIAGSLKLLEQHVPIQRRVLRAGDAVYRVGERFANLHIVHSGFFKIVNLSSDGRAQVVALHFKGDWLGFDGIGFGKHACEAVAMDTGEVWTVRYAALLEACAAQPALLTLLHTAMSQELTRDRDSLMSLCTLSADARVAQFLCRWVESLERRGLRTDQITLRMTRAEIGNYLGMRLESVSRALSRLAREKVISFVEKGHREVLIPDGAALARFVQHALASSTATIQ